MQLTEKAGSSCCRNAPEGIRLLRLLSGCGSRCQMWRSAPTFLLKIKIYHQDPVRKVGMRFFPTRQGLRKGIHFQQVGGGL